MDGDVESWDRVTGDVGAASDEGIGRLCVRGRARALSEAEVDALTVRR